MRWLVAFTLLLATFPLYSQSTDGSFALILEPNARAEVLRSGRATTVEPGQTEIPTVLQSGDQITNTGGQPLQIQLFPGGQRLVLAENSTVTIADTRTGEIELAYGRLLVTGGSEDQPVDIKTLEGSAAMESGLLAAEQFVSANTGEASQRFVVLDGEATVSGVAGEAQNLVAGRQFEVATASVGDIAAGVEPFWQSRPPAERIASTVLLQRFPTLEGELSRQLGDVPSYLLGGTAVAAESEQPPPEPANEDPVAIAAPIAEPADTEADQPAQPDSASAPSETGSEAGSGLFSGVGITLASSGVLTTTAGIAYSWFGGAISGGDQLSRETTTSALLYTGGGLILSGVLFYAVSLVSGN